MNDLLACTYFSWCTESGYILLLIFHLKLFQLETLVTSDSREAEIQVLLFSLAFGMYCCQITHSWLSSNVISSYSYQLIWFSITLFCPHPIFLHLLLFLCDFEFGHLKFNCPFGVQGVVAEVPEIIIRCVSRDEAALAVAQKVCFLFQWLMISPVVWL